MRAGPGTGTRTLPAGDPGPASSSARFVDYRCVRVIDDRGRIVWQPGWQRAALRSVRRADPDEACR